MRPTRTVTPLERQRNLRGMSRAELSRSSGVSERQIARLETPGAPAPTVPIQKCIAAAMHLPRTAMWPSRGPVPQQQRDDRAA